MVEGLAWGDGDVDTVVLQPVAGVANRWRGSYAHTYTARATDPLGWQPTLTVRDEEGAVSASFRVVVNDGPQLSRTGGAQLTNLTEGQASSWASYQICLSAAPTADVRVELWADDQVDFWDRVPTDPAGNDISFLPWSRTMERLSDPLQFPSECHSRPERLLHWRPNAGVKGNNCSTP